MSVKFLGVEVDGKLFKETPTQVTTYIVSVLDDFNGLEADVDEQEEQRKAG